jgi:polyphosphate kinase 2 (PPK2 family)
MDFCTKEQYQAFVQNCPIFERHIVKDGIHLIKFWLEGGPDEQERRFEARIDDPVRHWKLSPMNPESYSRWYASSRVRDRMLEMIDTKEAPWYIVRTDDKRRGRLTCIAGLLSLIRYE